MLDARRLRLSAEWALRELVDPSDIIAALVRLLRSSLPDTDDAIFAQHHIASLTVEKEPWKAALAARKLIALRPDDHRVYALMGQAMAYLKHYRAASLAYRKAVSLAPENPWYAHNLGHILDVALGLPAEGLALLETAHMAEPFDTEIATSYAHALGRVGRTEEAVMMLRRLVRYGVSNEHRKLLVWLDNTSPANQPDTLRRGIGSAETLNSPINQDNRRKRPHARSSRESTRPL